MARGDGGGGGGAFGWTILGILVGVTATLAVQTLMGGRNAQPVRDDVAAASEPLTPPAPPTPHFAPPAVAAPVNAVPTAPKTAPVAQTDQEVQDDADAVGMTSRSHAADGSPATAAPGAPQN